MSLTSKQRFWSYVRKTDYCWEWTGARTEKGYGRFGSSGRRNGIRAHRYSYELNNGPIPDGLFVLHKCDNPPCVRPEHLVLGSAKDNSSDMKSKGRHRHGGNHQGTKLTDHDVIDIRTLKVLGATIGDLARAFGVTHSAVSNIISRKYWVHLP